MPAAAGGGAGILHDDGGLHDDDDEEEGREDTPADTGDGMLVDGKEIMAEDGDRLDEENAQEPVYEEELER